MANPIIVYNSSTGSNDKASGAGPALAISGTAATIAGQVVTITTSANLIDEGVVSSGEHVLWLETTDGASNRRLFQIVGITDDTFTVSGAIVGNNLAWAVGGLRQGLENDTRLDWEDAEPGWVYEFQNGTYTITSPINTANVGTNVSGGVTFQAATGQSPVFDMTTTIDMFHFSLGQTAIQKIIGIKFTRSSGSGGSSFIRGSSNSPLYLQDCIFDCSGVTLGLELRASSQYIIDNCEIKNSDGHGLHAGFAVRAVCVIRGCSFHDNTLNGLNFASFGSNSNILIVNSLIYNNGAIGLDFNDVSTDDKNQIVIIGCTIHGNTDDGILNSQTTPNTRTTFSLFGNSISNNGGVGVNLSRAITKISVAMNDYNNYFSNTGGDRNNLPIGANDTAVNPSYESVVDNAEDFTPAAGSGLIDAITDRTA